MKLIASGTHTIGTTEWSLTNNSAVIAALTSKGAIDIVLDLTALTDQDTYTLKLYEKAAPGATQKLLARWDEFCGQFTQLLLISSQIGVIRVGNGWDVTLQNISGTPCSITWTVWQDGPDILDALAVIDTETDKIQGIDDNVDALKAGLIIKSGTTSTGCTTTDINLGNAGGTIADHYNGCLLVIGFGETNLQSRLILDTTWDQENQECHITVATLTNNFQPNNKDYIILSLGKSRVDNKGVLNDLAAGTEMDLVNAPNATALAALWNLATSSVTAGIGLQIKTNLDATISSIATAVSGVAAAVWAVGTRTLTGFGTLAADAATAVWGTVSRTITGTVTVGTNNDKTGYALTITPSVAGDKMDLVDAPNGTALTAVGTAVWATTVRTLSAATNITADIATAIWAALTAGNTVTGSFGKLIGTNLNATISSVFTVVSRIQSVFILRLGIMQDADSTTVALGSSASAIDDFYNGSILVITTGAGDGETRMIIDYNGTTKTATVDEPFNPIPAYPDEYYILSVGRSWISNRGVLNDITAASVWAVSARTLTAATNITADIATAVWANSTRTLTSFGTLVADIATAVWAAGSRTLTAGLLTAQQVWEYATRTITSGGITAAEVWGYVTRALTDKAGFTLHSDYDPAKTAASATELTAAQTAITDAIAALDTLIDAIKAKTDTITTDTATLAAIAALGALVDSVKAKTDLIPADPATLTALAAIDALIDLIKAKTDLIPTDPATLTALAALGVLIDAIKAKTDNLPASPASTSDVHLYEQEDLTE